jgi:hypothetical protein
MPVIAEPTQAEIQEAAAMFFSDFRDVQEFHDRILRFAMHTGRNAKYDAGLRSIVERQKRLMFELRNLYVNAYELLSQGQRSVVFRWIVQATGELKATAETLGGLGIAPFIIIGGVVVSGVVATALVAWHREISNQRKALELQEELIPLVAEGKLPADVLRPLPPTTISSAISGFSNALLLLGGLFLVWKLYQQWQGAQE